MAANLDKMTAPRLLPPPSLRVPSVVSVAPTAVAATTRTVMCVVLAALVAISVGGGGVADAKKDRNLPHPHRGLLKPYEPGPFESVQLSKQDEQKLASGQPVMKQTVADASNPAAGGGAICVQDVDAPKDAVWNQILDMNSYKGKVPKVLTAKNYYEGKTKDGDSRFKTRMVVGVLPGYSVRISEFVIAVRFSSVTHILEPW